MLIPKESGGPYNHEYSASNMLYFVREGYKITRERGSDFQIITTLYGPPGYVPKQKVLRGRDLDPDHKDDLADYLVSWAKVLISKYQDLNQVVLRLFDHWIMKRNFFQRKENTLKQIIL